MGRRKKTDTLFALISLSLVLVGLLILFSVSAPLAKEERGSIWAYVKHQLLLGVLPGLAIGFILFKLDIEFLKKWSLLLLAGNLLLTAAVFLPVVGLKVGGATRWLQLGSFSFQPSEFLKITLPLYFAVWLSRKKKKSLFTLFGFLVVLLPVAVILLAQPDMSSLVVLCFLSFLAYFLSDAPFSHTVILVGVGIAGAVLLIHFTPYRLSRFLVFLNPEMDPMGKGYQIKQSLIAIGSGQIFGKGLGLSNQKLGFLPNVISDSIFSAFCEETGFVGASLLILLFLLFFIRVIIKTARNRNKFASILAPTLAAGIVFQAFLNMGAMTGVLPLTGVPLPFVSYGGSHLLTELATCGLILNLLKE